MRGTVGKNWTSFLKFGQRVSSHVMMTKIALFCSLCHSSAVECRPVLRIQDSPVSSTSATGRFQWTTSKMINRQNPHKSISTTTTVTPFSTSHLATSKVWSIEDSQQASCKQELVQDQIPLSWQPLNEGTQLSFWMLSLEKETTHPNWAA